MKANRTRREFYREIIIYIDFSVTFHPCFVSRGPLSLFAIEHKNVMGNCFELGAVSQVEMKKSGKTLILQCTMRTAIFITTVHQFFHEAHDSPLDANIKHANKKTFNDETKDFCLVLNINFAFA